MTAEQAQQVAATTLAAMGLRPGMRTLITAPMYHGAPNAQAVFALALGIEPTIMPRFDPESFLALIEAQRITHAQVVPTMFVRLLDLPDPVRARYDLSSLECVVHTAASCPVHVKRHDRVVRTDHPRVLRRHRDRNRRRLRQPRLARSRGNGGKAARRRRDPGV
jgi:long-chain acyl-CoA synthetase